ncbi:MAG: WD40 repeat domain-containing protein, partial [Candidatus Thermochlorobacter sp.]
MAHCWSAVRHPAYTTKKKISRCVSGSIPNAELVATLVGHTDNVLDLDFSPDGKTIASVSRDKTVKLWKLGSP